jgi:nucleotide-binding universal stress UspA family protein
MSNMFERILVAYDGSEPSEKALEVALDIATKYSSQLEIVRVVDTSAIYSYLDVVPVDLEKQMYDEARKDLERAELRAKRKLPNAKTTLLSGDPASEILEYSHKNDFNLLVCGNRGRSKLKRVLLGSVSSRFAHESRVPVLIIR